MKAYLDSSGKSEDRQSRYVTLVCYLGTRAHFRRFESEWADVLEEFEAPVYRSETGDLRRYFHFKEAIHSRAGYARNKGWDPTKTKPLIGGLFNVFGRSERMAAGLVSGVVNLKGLAEARQDNPAIGTAETICADVCCSLLFDLRDRAGRRVSELIIDRGDWFSGRIASLWRTKKKSKRPWWADQLKSVTLADSHIHCGIQAVDLVAGIINRHYSKGPIDKWGGLLAATHLLASHDHVVINGRELIDQIDESGRYRPGNKLIRRGFKIGVPIVTKETA